MLPADTVVVDHSDDGLVIMDTRTSRVYATNAIGADVWSRLRARESEEAILKYYEATFFPQNPTVVAEVTQFLATLRELGLAEQ